MHASRWFQVRLNFDDLQSGRRRQPVKVTLPNTALVRPASADSPFFSAYLAAGMKEFSMTAKAWAIKLRDMLSVRDPAKLPVASNLIQ
jgi:hypothetical protein